MNLARRAMSEAIGTGLLTATVVGSGMMAERLCGGNIALALLANTLATAAALVALILTFGPISGAHFNPVVTLASAWQRNLAWPDVPAYLFSQVAGAVSGVAVAQLMFGEALFSLSQHARKGGAQFFSEFIATFGLVTVILVCGRLRAQVTPFAVAAYIAAAYWFTASTSFANPAVTIGRALTNSFAGIRPVDVPAFVVAQFLGTIAATLLGGWLIQEQRK